MVHVIVVGQAVVELFTGCSMASCQQVREGQLDFINRQSLCHHPALHNNDAAT